MEKFQAIDLRTGEKLPPEKTFTLVPDRDPIAVLALKTYRDNTPNDDLKVKLTAWIERLES